jgi:hypothetical protein
MNALVQWIADSKPERRPVKSLVPYARNARVHSPGQLDQLAASMREFGVVWPALVDEKTGEIIAGHGRILAAEKNGWPDYPVIVARGWSQKQIKAYRIADNRLAENAAWDLQLLAAELGELPGMEALIGFAEGELEALLKSGEGRPLPSAEEARQTLAERFGLPPFSVLNAREGWWQDRKRAWLGLGIESELGRGENLLQFSDTINEPDPTKRAAKKNAKAASFETGVEHGRGKPGTSGDQIFAKPRKATARNLGQDILNGEGGITPARGLTTKGQRVRREKGTVVAGKGWAEGGPARRDAAFYAKKRAWEKANGRKVSTTEFREKYWNGAA